MEHAPPTRRPDFRSRPPLLSGRIHRCGPIPCQCSAGERERHAFASTNDNRGLTDTIEGAVSSSGQSLNPAMRGDMEQRFGHDFGRVRIHTNALAAESATGLHALAYTFGQDIMFAPGRYAPDTSAGRRLIAHELAHVRQQATAPAPAAGSGLVVSRPTDPDEHAANRIADGVGAAPAAKQSLKLASTEVSKAARAACDKQCGALIGGISYGETECDMGARGSPTGEVRVTVTDTDACTRPCVEKHEAAHAVHLGPVCRELHTCLKAAGEKFDASDKCWETFQNRTYAMAPAMECAAYTAEATCMHSPQPKACSSTEAKSRLAKRLAGVECYRDCFCKSTTSGAAPHRSK